MKINKTDKVLQVYNNMGANRANLNKINWKDGDRFSERAKDYNCNK